MEEDEKEGPRQWIDRQISRCNRKCQIVQVVSNIHIDLSWRIC